MPWRGQFGPGDRAPRRTTSRLAGFGLGKNTYIADFDWVNPERVVFGTARKFGALDNPQLTGNLYAMNADGTGKDILVGQDVDVMTHRHRTSRPRRPRWSRRSWSTTCLATTTTC